MATTTLTYNQNGDAEDFENVIFDVSPTDTPLISLAKRKSATQKIHYWQMDELDAATHNPVVEGADATYATVTPTVELGNYCQIIRRTFDVSGTQEAIKKYGRRSEIQRLAVKKMKEWKRDVEKSAVGSQVANVGSAASARAMAGLEAWITSNSGNAFKLAASSLHSTDTFTNGIPVTAITHGSTTTFTEAALKSALELAWNDGGDPSVLMMRPGNKNYLDSFAGVATKYNEVKGANQATIIGAADIYVSSFGNHSVVLNRYMSLDTVLCIDPDYVSFAWLRPAKMETLAKVGDGERRMIIGEGTLVVDNPFAHAKVVDLNAT